MHGMRRFTVSMFSSYSLDYDEPFLVGYSKHNSEVLLIVPLLFGTVYLHIASPEAMKEISDDLKAWQKPPIAGVTMPRLQRNDGLKWNLFR